MAASDVDVTDISDNESEKTSDSDFSNTETGQIIYCHFLLFSHSALKVKQKVHFFFNFYFMKESFLRKVEICKKGEGLIDNRLRGVLIELIFNSVLKGEKRLSFYLYEMNLKMRESIFIVRLNKEVPVYGIEKDLD